MSGINYEQLHLANNMPIRVQSLYKDLYATINEGRNSGVDDPAMRELEFHVRTKGPQVEVIEGDGHWRGSRLLLRSDSPLMSPSAAIPIQITIDKDAVRKLLSAMRCKRDGGGFVGLRYYNAMLVLPNVVELGEEPSTSSGELTSPIPPRHHVIARYTFVHEDKPALLRAMLQIEADTGMSPFEHRRWLVNEANRTELSG